MNDKASGFDTDVLVIGAGPVGLALGLELGLRGNRVILIERDPSRGPQPRAKTLNMRSLTHLRRWGLAEQVRAASPLPEGYPTDVVFRTRLYGHHIATVPNIYFRGNARADDPRFPEPSEWTPQYEVERVMKRRLDGLPTVEQRYGTELTGFVQDAQSVTATLRRPDGTSADVRCRFLIGADGARSHVREALGIRLKGRYAFGANYNMIVDIPALREAPPEPAGIMHWTINPDYPGVLGPIGEYWYAALRLPEGQSGMSDEEIERFITASVGRPVAFEIKAVDPWYAHELIAERYRDGRIFLAGDACHLHPPFGGYGMNMGIADAVDIGWKLDAVLHGWGGEALLESYEFERQRVHQWTIDEAVANYAVLSDDLVQPDLEEDGTAGDARRAAVAEQVVEQKKREFHTIGMVLGYHYAGSPVIVGGGDLPPPEPEAYDPVAVPGALAPHYWIAPGRSLYDEFGTGLTLLTRGADPISVEALEAAAKLMAIPLTILPRDDADPALYPAHLTLIRPDQHVAWSGDTVDRGDADAILGKVAGRPLSDERGDKPLWT